jgi:hypothetical protein
MASAPQPVAGSRLLTNVVALAWGMLTGVALAFAMVVAALVINAAFGPPMFSASRSISIHGALVSAPTFLLIALPPALLYGCVIAMLCTPIWWGLAKVGRQRMVDASALGFAVTFIIWGLTDLLGGRPLHAYMLLESALLGAAGAGAGLVTWRVRYRGRAGPPRIPSPLAGEGQSQ